MTNFTDENKPEIKTLIEPAFNKNNISISVLLDFKCYPLQNNFSNINTQLNGNKWRKLKLNIAKIKQENKLGIVSFGGAYSNHLYALAAAAKIFDLKTIGIVRGEMPKPINPTLQFCTKNEMKLISWTRTKYKQKNTTAILNELKQQYKNYEIIEEGGTNLLAIKGVSEIWQYIKLNYDYIFLPIGTSGTFAGTVFGSKGKSKIIGIPVLKMNFKSIVENYLKQLNYTAKNYEINNNYTFNGYAKFNEQLIAFANNFYKNHNIKLDPIYNAKSFYAVYDLIKNKQIKTNSKILIIHTGGLQSIAGFNLRFGNILNY